MKISESTALVDADFLIHIAEINWSIEKKRSSLRLLFDAMNIEASVHPLVYQNEIPPENVNVSILVDDVIISAPSFDDFFGTSTDVRNYYEFVVRELFSRLTGSSELLCDQDIFSFWRRGNSLGEVHSIALCVSCGCGMFLSDDRDSKLLVSKAQDYCPAKFKVYNRAEVIDSLGDKKYEVFENRKDRKAFTHTP